MLRRWLGLLGLWLMLATPLLAQDVPPPLRDWQAWVLHDSPQHDCPFLSSQPPGADSYACAWPGRLTLDAGKDGAHFALDVHVDAPGWITLPGDVRHWPQQVTANNQPAVVLQQNNLPALWLAPGDYQVRGAFPWSARPSRLQVPAAIGLITLTVDGVAVTRVERNADQLTLGEAEAAQRAADALSLRVYRRLQDGLPATLETQLQFDVAGSARELVLGPVLPGGFIATALSGDLPARLENDGRLRVQLRPGQWTLTLAARSAANLDKVALKLPAAPWPRQEIWSYADDTTLRSTRVAGNATDAAQAGVPDDWNALPAYVLDDASGLAIEQGTRGDEGGQGDRLNLQRELWLDFDGRGFNVADHLTGELRHQQRLDAMAPWQLQRAAQNGDPLLITTSLHGSNGVELRERQLNLTAGLRLPEHGGAIPSSGWQLPVENIDATLHLPYGYRLLGAIGADRSPDSWIGQWSLLDLFVLALIALLAGRLLGWPWALLAAAYLALAQHEGHAPLWTLAAVLALMLLLRALPVGRLHRYARAGALLVFALALLCTLPFVASQLQYAMHPQLEAATDSRMMSASFADRSDNKDKLFYYEKAKSAKSTEEASENAVAASPPAPPGPPAPPMAESAPPPEPVTTAPSQGLSAVKVTGASMNLQQDSRSVVQAGAGTPQWNEGNNYRLGWSGPVTPEQSTHLVIAPAWLIRMLRVLLVALLATLLAKLAQNLFAPLRGRWQAWRHGRTVSAALLMLALLPHGAHAQNFPSQPLLDQLRNRLEEAPKCAPQCAGLAQAHVQANGDTLSVLLEAHIGATVAMPLPHEDGALQLIEVAVDGHANAPLLRRDDELWVRLDRGVHQISLRYHVGTADSTTINFALRPQHVSFNGAGWSLDGVDDGRPLGDSIALHRVQAAGAGKDLAPVQNFPPYVRLTRSLVLGLDWTVENTVERIAPQDGGFSIALPLLAGEHPLGDDALVRDGRISITFNANVNVVHWTSRLDHIAKLSLQSPPLGERAETWEIHVSPMWHVDAQGVPTSASADGLHYQPLPGETLQLALTQPQAVVGDSLAFDGVQLGSTIGERASETTLTLHARSTRGGEHAIDLPTGAELLDAQRDGESINLAVREGKLSLPLLPGEHVYALHLREPHGITTHVGTPSFALHAPVANIDLALQLPQNRWVLWTWGPTNGPAVMVWSQLLVLLLASWLLARYAPTPLRFHQWLLLGLGFSAFAWSAYALVVVWLIVFGLRARRVSAEHRNTAIFNLLQFGLAALTMLALVVLVSAVPKGLLGLPDMHIAGNDSDAWNLRWFADQSANALPNGGVLSVSLWVYKIAMLLWALWLANALIGWLRWAFNAWTSGGYWAAHAPKPVVAPPELPTDADAELPPHG
ncbi:hypothetical protein [Rhodanobacter sp. L36]|uniref:hypothetical protein n=1 Tax=Rhodanobacter sp. L36 TaxID=1747221 RepID=UPI00131D46AF|nr:hypothetical protein [Rhodanobacter sp. L36]